MKLYIAGLSFLTALATAGSANSSKRQLISTDTIIQDIENIHNAVLANQAATARFNGGNVVVTLIEGTPVIATVGAIHVVNRKGFLDANLSGPVDEAGTRSIVQTVRDTVAISIPNAVNTIVSKKSVFVSSGQRQLVIGSLGLLLNDHDTFSAALLEKLYTGDTALTAEGNALVAKIHNAIQGGIDAYST